MIEAHDTLKRKVSVYQTYISSNTTQSKILFHVINNGEATIHRSHRFFPVDQSMETFYEKPIFSRILDSVF